MICSHQKDQIGDPSVLPEELAVKAVKQQDEVRKGSAPETR
jgi:hypothetical protein